MVMTPAAVLALALRCAPSVAPETLLAVARAESRLDPLAIGVNGGARPGRAGLDSDGAVASARRRLARGENLDLGLAQINSANMARLGLSLDTVFDPCRNLAAAARVLREDYRPVREDGSDTQVALRDALSRYNTGDPRRGFRNGYVARVEAAAGLTAAALASPAPTSRPPPPASWDVFARATPAAFVAAPNPQGAQP